MQNSDTSTWQASPAGQQVMQTFSQEKTLHAIERLLARIDTLEQAVENLSGIMNQGPGLVAMVGDMADDAYRQADARGVNIDERLKNALSIAEKLTAPEMVEKLDGLLVMANQAPGLVAMVGDIVDDGYRQADANGISIDARLKTAVAMAEKLTQPAMMSKLNSLMGMADQAPGMVAMVGDMVDDGMKSAIAKGFDPQVLGEAVGAMGIALSKAKTEEPAKVGGIFGLFRVLKDSDNQRGLGFLVNFLKHLGKNV